MRPIARLAALAATIAPLLLATPAAVGAGRPNIVWIVVDDMSPNFSCYGETTIQTPNVDRLAREGTRFAEAFVTAPVCSPCRSALITGMYQTSIGAQNHRSGRGAEKIVLPEGVEPIPALLRRHGYYTAIGSPNSRSQLGKTDYNFEWDRSMYDGADWSGRKPGQPFFMQVQLNGGKLREGANWLKTVRKRHVPTKAEAVTLPPYYPRDPVLLEDWAAYLDAVRQTDRQVGEVLARLRSEGILDETVVMFLTDHGISHARGKQFLYDEGIRVALLMRGPGVPAGAAREDLVSQIDMTATTLALAGVPIPPRMQGRDLLAKDYAPRDAVFSARDRCDETVDQIRSVRTARHKYIRNGLPGRPMLQPNRYKDAKPILIRLRELHASGGLDELQERILFAPTRPKEELYDLQADPHELRNLADDPAHRATLEALRKRLDDWTAETGDQGARPESAALYDSDMKVYLDAMQPDVAEDIRRNIATMQAWAAAGK